VTAYDQGSGPVDCKAAGPVILGLNVVTLSGPACLDLNQGPLPYQHWAIMGRGVIRTVLVAVRVCRLSLIGAGVAVTSAVSRSLMAWPGRRFRDSPGNLPVGVRGLQSRRVPSWLIRLPTVTTATGLGSRSPVCAAR
jgi:hypothetical protein